jgi:hypothetical protein
MGCGGAELGYRIATLVEAQRFKCLDDFQPPEMLQATPLGNRGFKAAT